MAALDQFSFSLPEKGREKTTERLHPAKAPHNLLLTDTSRLLGFQSLVPKAAGSWLWLHSGLQRAGKRTAVGGMNSRVALF